MNTTSNRLMPWIQAISGMVVLALFCVLAVGPMFGLKDADPAMVEAAKNFALILISFLFGSAVGSAKKDETIASQLEKPAQPVAAQPEVAQ